MPKLTILEELAVAIKSAARDADPEAPSRDVARNFYSDNREMISSVADQWIVEKLAQLIGKHRAKARRESDEQFVMEASLGFCKLPKRLETPDGVMVERGGATIETWREALRGARKLKSPMVAQAEKAIALMSKYTASNRRITWAEVLKRETNG